MQPSSAAGRPARRFRSAGGLPFVAAALALLAPPSTAWAPPVARCMTHHRPAITSAARLMGGPPTPSPSTARLPSSLPMVSNARDAAASPDQRPLAREGDWGAYLDPNYGRVYYFNHSSGESAWDPPTPTFPVPRPANGGGAPGMNGRNGRDGPMGGGPMMEGPMGGGPMVGGMGGPMGEMDPRMMGGPGMGPGPRGPGGPQMNMGPQGQGQQPGQQPGQQQQQQPNFYEILQVPPTATRAQIKQSYLNLGKMYDARMEGGRRSKEFNEIARAWMVLSDGRLRERYDRQMEQWDRERRMREKVMEEEREWMVERGMMGEENKFAKDPVYRKKMEVRDDDGTNKFRAFRPPPQEQGFGARPLEIDEEAEARNARRERDALVREKAEAEAQLAQEQRRQQVDRQRQREERRRASSERDVIQDSSRPTATQRPMQPGQQDMNALMADMKQRFAEKKTDEASRVNDELTRLQGGGGGGGSSAVGSAGGSSFTSPISQGQSSGQGSSRRTPKRTPGGGGRSMLFPGKGGIVVEDSEFVAKDILIDEFMGRKTDAQPKFISWVEPEEDTSSSEAAENIRAAMDNVQGPPNPVRDRPDSRRMRGGPPPAGEVGPDGGGPPPPGRMRGGPPPPGAMRGGPPPPGTMRGGPPPPGVMRGGPPPMPGGVPPAATMSGEQERERERLNQMRGPGGRTVGGQSVPSDGFGSQLKSGPINAGQPPKTSTSAKEQERLQGMRATSFGGARTGVPPPGAERTILTTPPAPGAGAKTSTSQREQQRLQNMGARGIPGQPQTQSGFGGQTAAGSPPGPNAQELEKAHRAELEKLKQDMEDVASKTLENEIVKIAKIHAGEITKLKEEYARNMQSGQEESARMQQLKMDQAAQRDRMKAEITREVEAANAQKIQRMQAAHKAEMDKLVADAGDSEATMRLQEEIEALNKNHFAELENMAAKHDAEMAQLRKDLEARSAEMTQAHQLEIQKLKQDQKAASATDALKSQQAAMDKLGAQHTQQMEAMTAQHAQAMDQLRKELGVNSERQVRLKVEEVTKSMAAQHKLEMDKMAAQHKQEMQTVAQNELQKLKQEHARELESALAEKKRLQQQADNVKRELRGGPGATMTTDQRIQMVLKSFEGVYDPFLIDQLRKDLKAREGELDKQIKQSNAQMNALQARMNSSGDEEKKLNDQIRTLTQWKQSAETELERVKQSTTERSDEVRTLKDSIQSMTKEISGLNSQLERLTKERDAGKKEIWELREWRKNAEVERGQLEKELKSKDGVIAKLEYDFKERDEDVNALIPEIARLQELTVALEQLNEKRSHDFGLLQQETDRLKVQYEKESRSASDMAQTLKGQLASEQTKNSQLISQLQGDLKAKAAEMSKLQTTADERSRTIAEMTSKLEIYSKDSERAVEDSKKKIASMNAEFEREMARRGAAHKAELEQLEKKLQTELQRLQQDLSARSNTIADLKTKLDASSASNKQLTGEIVGLSSQRQSAESLLKQSSQNLDAAKRDVERLTQQIHEAKTKDSTNTARIQALERQLADKASMLTRLESGAKQHASEKERLLADLNNLKLWKDSAQSAISSLSNEIALNAVSNEIAQAKEGTIDGIIEKLSSIRNELHQKDVQLNSVKAATDALTKNAAPDVQSQSSPPAGGASWSRTTAPPATNVVGSGFGSRQKNVAGGGSSTMNAYDAAIEQSKASPAQKKQQGGYLDSLGRKL